MGQIVAWHQCLLRMSATFRLPGRWVRIRNFAADTFYLDPGRDTVDVQTYVRVGWSYARDGRAYIHVSLDGRTCEPSAMC
jgi:hypothetical protein